MYYSKNFVSFLRIFNKHIRAFFICVDNQLNELMATTAHLQEESARLEREARQLIDENIQVQIEARLLKEKYRHRQQQRRCRRRQKKSSWNLVREKLNFQQLKRQLQRQRQSFLRFERRLRAKYEQPFHQIVATPSGQRCRRIRSMPSESID